MVLLIFWIGVYPKPFFDRLEPAIKQVLAQVEVARKSQAVVPFVEPTAPAAATTHVVGAESVTGVN